MNYGPEAGGERQIMIALSERYPRKSEDRIDKEAKTKGSGLHYLGTTDDGSSAKTYILFPHDGSSVRQISCVYASRQSDVCDMHFTHQDILIVRVTFNSSLLEEIESIDAKINELLQLSVTRQAI
jgi:hypothetical protein